MGRCPRPSGASWAVAEAGRAAVRVRVRVRVRVGV